MACSASTTIFFQVLGGENGAIPKETYDTVYEYDPGFQIWRNDYVMPRLNRAASSLSAVMVDSLAVNCS